MEKKSIDKVEELTKKVEKLEIEVNLLKIEKYNLGLALLRVDRSKRVLRTSEDDVDTLALKIASVVKLSEDCLDVPDNYQFIKIKEAITNWLDTRDIVL